MPVCYMLFVSVSLKSLLLLGGSHSSASGLTGYVYLLVLAAPSITLVIPLLVWCERKFSFIWKVCIELLLCSKGLQRQEIIEDNLLRSEVYKMLWINITRCPHGLPIRKYEENMTCVARSFLLLILSSELPGFCVWLCQAQFLNGQDRVNKLVNN